MYDLSKIDDNNNYVCPEFINVGSMIINTDMLREYLIISKHKVTKVNISKVEYKPLVFISDFTNAKLNSIDVDNYDPIILLTGVTLPEEKSYLCIDGKHRINKLSKNNKEKCNAYVVDFKLVKQFLNRF
jgi:hypothetical protein